MGYSVTNPRVDSGQRRLVSVRIDESVYDQIDKLARQHDIPFVSMLREIINKGTRHAAQPNHRPDQP